MRERDSLCYQAVDGWRADIRVSQRADRVKTLLVRAVPEDIRAVHLKHLFVVTVGTAGYSGYSGLVWAAVG